MERYRPYYAQDADGVHFQVNVDVFVQAYVSQTVLHIAYGSSEPRAQCPATYLEHRGTSTARCGDVFHAFGPETVLVRQQRLSCTGPRRRSVLYLAVDRNKSVRP